MVSKTRLMQTVQNIASILVVVMAVKFNALAVIHFWASHPFKTLVVAICAFPQLSLSTLVTGNSSLHDNAECV